MATIGGKIKKHHDQLRLAQGSLMRKSGVRQVNFMKIEDNLYKR